MISICVHNYTLLKTKLGYKIAEQTAFKYLSARIEECHKKKRRLDTDRYFELRQLQYVLKPSHFTSVESHLQNVLTAEKTRCKDSQKSKFQKLFKGQNRSRFQDEWIVNLSSTTITDHQKSVLSKGLNFAPTPNKVPVPKIIGNIETALKYSKASLESISQARSQIVKILSKQRKLTPNLSPEESKALKELKNNESIMILPADKGRATVIMDKDDYDRKMVSMLNDADVYKKLTRDPCPGLERKMNSTLLKLNRSLQIPDPLYNRLRSSGVQTPRIYGLPKIHKQDTPLRPIISFYTSPTYQLSKHLSHILGRKNTVCCTELQRFCEFYLFTETEWGSPNII